MMMMTGDYVVCTFNAKRPSELYARKYPNDQQLLLSYDADKPPVYILWHRLMCTINVSLNRVDVMNIQNDVQQNFNAEEKWNSYCAQQSEIMSFKHRGMSQKLEFIKQY